MPKQYSHRNGEILHPTEAGYYWIWGAMSPEDDPWEVQGMHACILVQPFDHEGEQKYMFDYGAGSLSDTAVVSRVVCRWWGPVEPPWAEEVPTND